MAFADYYPLESFRGIADAAWWRANDWNTAENSQSEDYRAAVEADSKDRERIAEHKKIFKQALESHLTDLRAQGKLAKATGLGGRQIAIANAWNNFVDGKPADYSFRWLMDSFSSVWTRFFVKMDDSRWARKQEETHVPGSHAIPSEEMIVAGWEMICEQFEVGTSIIDNSRFSYWDIEATDSITGDRCYLHFYEWRAVVMKRNAAYDLEAVSDVDELGIITAEFSVPTGKLMITDALRIEHFNNGTDFEPDRDYNELSLNSGHGRSKRISTHAEEHDVGYTQTTNTSVAVFQDGEGRLLVTERWNDDLATDKDGELLLKGWKRVGTFSCDVWSVMAFDRNIAIDRMADGGSENPEEELDAYLISKDCYAENIVQIDVKPGEWQIYAGERFSEQVDRKAMRLPEDIHIWCLLQKL